MVRVRDSNFIPMDYHEIKDSSILNVCYIWNIMGVRVMVMVMVRGGFIVRVAIRVRVSVGLD